MANGAIFRQLLKATVNDLAESGGEPGVVENEALAEALQNKEPNRLVGKPEPPLWEASSSNQDGGHENDNNIGDQIDVLRIRPLANERGWPMIDYVQPQCPLAEMLLPEDQKEALRELLDEHRKADVLARFGSKPSNKILLHGPSGCGRGMAAQALATELDLPLARVRVDVLLSAPDLAASHLRRLFDFVAYQVMIVSIEDIELLYSHEAGGIGLRYTLLQLLEDYSGKSLILASTRDEKALDRTLLRRFEDVLHFDFPGPEQVVKILATELEGVRHQFALDNRVVLQLMNKRSVADIQSIVRRALRRMFLSGRELLIIRDLKNAAARQSK